MDTTLERLRRQEIPDSHFDRVIMGSGSGSGISKYLIIRLRVTIATESSWGLQE